jgi:hypothetical protein
MIGLRLAHKALVLNELDRWLLLTDATHDPVAAGRQLTCRACHPPRPSRMLQAPFGSE